MPDLEYCVKEYLNDPNLSALDFMKNLDIGLEERPKTIRSLIYDYFQNSKHYWMWDYASLENELEKAGFTDIRQAYYGDSDYKIYNTIEEYSRWENCLGIECQK